MDLGLKGKFAAVAAGSAGLGLAVARSLAAEGVRVAICGRRPEPLVAAAREFDGIPIVADLSLPQEAGAFVTQAIAELGAVDILVINSGGPPAGNFETSSFAAYEAALRTNLLSAVAMCQSAVPAMKARGWGRVLAISSASARQPRPENIMTGMARAGLTAFLKAMALEIAATGVTVNTLQPGPHQTSRLDELFGTAVQSLADDIPVRTLGRPQDFGQVAAFLCSDQARFITGSSLLVDGGIYPGIF